MLNSIAAYVEQQNRQMNRQVRLNVQVLSVSTSRKELLGLDWNIVYKSLRSAGASLNNVSGDIANATSASVSILDSATGNAAKFAGSSMLIKALSEQGDVSVVTSQGQRDHEPDAGAYPDGRPDGVCGAELDHHDHRCGARPLH
ncbi:lipoprotein [Salmonella enterica subsp. enterica]|nr:lipoprotein [Salmonella enterica subsp. enterica]